MGLLRNLRTGRTVALGARVLVGRAGTCALCLDSRMVSNEHASIWWEGGAWLVRDVGSRNGTKLNGRSLEPGERARVPVDGVLVFGHDEQTWALVDPGAPVALARCDDGTVVPAQGGVLSLPNAEDPQVMVFEGADGQWNAEGPLFSPLAAENPSAEPGHPRLAPDFVGRSSSDTGIRPRLSGDSWGPTGSRIVRDGAAVAVAGRAWILHLPQGDVSTWSPSVETAAISTIGLRFRVSRDEEYIELFLLHAGKETQLQTRAHFELLLTLARARVEDADHPPAERGWRYADAVQKDLGMDNAPFNLYIFRARQQFGEAEIAGAAAIVERRAPTGQVRLGVDRIEIVSL